MGRNSPFLLWKKVFLIENSLEVPFLALKILFDRTINLCNDYQRNKGVTGRRKLGGHFYL
jgi:ABC-type histidine transport system ATPase subunit